MALQRERPYPGFNFLVDLGTGMTEGAQAGFEEVSFPEVSIELVDYRAGNEKGNAPRKLTTHEHSTNLVLKRGAIGSLDLYQWWSQVRNEDHTAVVLTWMFLRARPAKLRFSNLEAQTKNVLVEYLEIAFERFEMA